MTSNALLALLPQYAWVQTQKVFAHLDFQEYATDPLDAARLFEQNRINLSASQCILTSGNFPRGNNDGTNSDLGRVLARFIESYERPVIVLRTGEDAPADILIAEVTRRLQESGRGDLAHLLMTCEPEFTALESMLTTQVPSLAHGQAHAPILLDVRVDDSASGGFNPVVAFTSGKGGCGKSFLTNLTAVTAAHLGNQNGKRLNVVVVELDLDDSKSRFLYHPENPDGVRTITDVLNAGTPTEETIRENLTTIHAPGVFPEGSLRFLYGPRSLRDAGAVTPESVRAIFHHLRRMRDVDFVLVDSKNISHGVVREALTGSDLVCYIINDVGGEDYANAETHIHTIVNDVDVPSGKIRIVINNTPQDRRDETFQESVADSTGGYFALECIPESSAARKRRGRAAWESGAQWTIPFEEGDPAFGDALSRLARSLAPAPKSGE